MCSLLKEKIKSSQIYELVSVFETPLCSTLQMPRYMLFGTTFERALKRDPNVNCGTVILMQCEELWQKREMTHITSSGPFY